MKKEKHKITNNTTGNTGLNCSKLKLDNDIHWIDIPLDGKIIFPSTYLLDSDLIIFGG